MVFGHDGVRVRVMVGVRVRIWVWYVAPDGMLWKHDILQQHGIWT